MFVLVDGGLTQALKGVGFDLTLACHNKLNMGDLESEMHPLYAVVGGAILGGRSALHRSHTEFPWLSGTFKHLIRGQGTASHVH